MKLPRIEGRECVPVRLLPFLSDWDPLSPDVIAGLFAMNKPGRRWSISSFILRPDGTFDMVEPRSWVDPALDLEELEVELKSANQPHTEWRRRSVALLPASVFVWRDELELQYARTYRRLGYSNERPGTTEISELDLESQLEAMVSAYASEVTFEEPGDDCTPWPSNLTEGCDRRLAGNGELNFTPLLSSEDDRLVYEGFESLLAGSSEVGGPAQLMPSPDDRRTETAKERRERLLRWHDEEVEKSSKRGALARVVEREKLRRPSADRSNTGKEISKARRERDAATRAGPFDALLPTGRRTPNLPRTYPEPRAPHL